MINLRRIDGDELHAGGHEPLGGVFRKARRVAEIVQAVAVAAVPAGVDDDDIFRLNRRLCRGEIFGLEWCDVDRAAGVTRGKNESGGGAGPRLDGEP